MLYEVGGFGNGLFVFVVGVKVGLCNCCDNYCLFLNFLLLCGGVLWMVKLFFFVVLYMFVEVVCCGSMK